MLHLVDEKEVIDQTHAHHREPQFFAGDRTQQKDKTLYQVTMPCSCWEASSITAGRSTCMVREKANKY